MLFPLFQQFVSSNKKEPPGPTINKKASSNSIWISFLQKKIFFTMMNVNLQFVCESIIVSFFFLSPRNRGKEKKAVNLHKVTYCVTLQP